MDSQRDEMDDDQFLMDMIASGSAAAAPHAYDTANTDIYLNMSGGEEIDQNTAAADQEANVYT
jgi:hypothetical protein